MILAVYDYRKMLLKLSCAEEQMRVANGDLETANRQLELANRDLAIAHTAAQSAAQTNEAFIARLVRDLAPPVQGLTSVISGSSWPVEHQADHDIAHRQLRFLETFIHQARTYLQTRTVTLACTKVPLLPLCHTALSTVALRAQQRDIQIIQEIEVEYPMVWGDETAILRILDNLLTNALGVTPDGGAITLRVITPTPAWVEIAIVDQGPGIPAERQALLLQPYHAIQPNTLTPSPTGTGLGLGLAIVRELTTTLGGECGVESQPGVGSTFFVRLAREVPHYVTAEA